MNNTIKLAVCVAAVAAVTLAEKLVKDNAPEVYDDFENSVNNAVTGVSETVKDIFTGTSSYIGGLLFGACKLMAVLVDVVMSLARLIYTAMMTACTNMKTKLVRKEKS